MLLWRGKIIVIPRPLPLRETLAMNEWGCRREGRRERVTGGGSIVSAITCRPIFVSRGQKSETERKCDGKLEVLEEEVEEEEENRGGGRGGGKSDGKIENGMKEVRKERGMLVSSCASFVIFLNLYLCINSFICVLQSRKRLRGKENKRITQKEG